MNKWLNRAFLAGLLALLLAVPVGTALWGAGKTAAYYENRTLAERPALTWVSLWDGTFGTALESWLSDHFPGRATLLKADTAVQMKLRPVVNGAVLGGEVLLPFRDYDTWSAEEQSAQAAERGEAFAALNGYIQENGGTFLFVGFPEQRTYFDDQYPAYLNSCAEETASASRLFREALEDRDVPFLDMGEVYDAQGHPASYYASVDHHYTWYGAWAAYQEIMDTLNDSGFRLPVLAEDDLDIQTLPNPCIGSRNRKLYDLWPNEDHIVLGIQKNPVAFDRRDNGQPSSTPLFVTPSSPAEPATYGIYMGGDYGETALETHRPELPKLLIFGDSFTNALETLLYASFDETRSMDLRHYHGGSLRDYIADYRPDVVLCVLNDSFYYTTTGNGAVWGD